MSKIVYNACYGGFNLSEKAVARYAELAGIAVDDVDDRDIVRHDPILVRVVEELGDAANGQCAALCIKDIPSGTQYRIDEYDGYESVATHDSYEWETAP